MTLETVGSHFLNVSRTLHSRRSCSVEVVQYLTPLPGYDRLSVQGRVNSLIAKGGVDIWLRVDYSSTSSQPPLNDLNSLFNFNSFLMGLANDPAFGKCRGFIIGNEPNLSGIPAAWVARCVYGFGAAAGDTNNAYQFVTTVNAAMQVLAPAVAPWSAATDGDLGSVAGDPSYPAPPDSRTALMAWERYQAALAWRCYNNGYHAPYGSVQFCMHIYSNVAAAALLGPAANEPNLDLRDSSWHNAHNGSHVFDDMQYEMIWAAGGNPPPILIGEWNTYINGSWPCDNYPSGLLANLVREYLLFKPNVMGLASFVDQNYAGGAPNWLNTAICGYLDTSGALTTAQKARLQAWDTDLNDLLANGWT